MINKFEKQYRFLSNFYLCDIMFEGDIYPSVEHAYQAAKTLDKKSRLIFMEPELTSAESKKYGRKLKVRDDWESIKIDVMYQLLKCKFNKPKFKELLLNTGDVELIEGNWWGDKFWGVCNGEGQNWLGKLLMKIRAELKQ